VSRAQRGERERHRPGERSIAGDVARLAAPAIAQSLLQTMVFLVDRAMLGRHSEEALASMQISGPVVWSLASCAQVVQIGAIAVVGRAIGAGKRHDAAAAVRAGLAAALALGLGAGALGLALLPGLLALFPAAGEAVRAEASAYLLALLPALPLLLLTTMAAAVHQAAGDTRTPLAVAIVANAVNAVAGYVLIFGHGVSEHGVSEHGGAGSGVLSLGAVPAMGARGAALASVIALAIEATVLIALIWRGRGVIAMRGRGGEREQLARMRRVALPALLERLAQHGGYFAYVTMIGALGPLAMAANQAMISIESIAFLSADGFGIAAAAIVAQRLGAGRPDQARDAARIAAYLAAAALSACGALFVIAPRALASAFSTDSAIVAATIPCLAVAAVAQPFMATSVVLGDALRGAGATRATLAITLIGGLVVRLAATAIFAFGLELGLVGVWIGSTVDWLVRTMLVVWLFRRGSWTRLRV
jgi:putative MATE family efflux protein